MAAKRLPRIIVRREDGDSRKSWFGDGTPASKMVTTHMIFWTTLGLLAIGLMMIFSATTILDISVGINPYIGFYRTLVIAGVGLTAMFLLALKIPSAWLRASALAIFGFCLLLQFAVRTPLGISVGGNRNWILIPGINQVIQPSELLKLGLSLYLAWVFMSGRLNITSPKSVALWLGIPVGITFGAVLAGHDLGTLLVFVCIVFSAVYIGGMKKSWLATAGLIGVAGAAFMVAISPSRRARVLTFLPWNKGDKLDLGLQPLRARWGLGTGGLTGIGPGGSRQKWNYLPEAHTDFIFAILGEEFGLIGTVSVIVLFAILGLGIIRVLHHAKHMDLCIFSACLGGWVLSQAMINIGMVIGLLPVIGVPLPLVSSGGSAMLSTLIAIGVILAYARDEAYAGPLRLRNTFPRSSALLAPSSLRSSKTSVPVTSLVQKGRS